jgi:hypothetical protein
MWRSLDTLVVVLEDDCRRLHGHYMRLRPDIVAMTDKLSATRRGHAVVHASRHVG